MRIAALGNLEPTQRVDDGAELLRIGSHVVLQAAFIAPGMALMGSRGWRLILGSLGGSVSFTLLSWLWAYANGFQMLPMTAPSSEQLGAAKAPPRRKKKARLPEPPPESFIDV